MRRAAFIVIGLSALISILIVAPFNAHEADIENNKKIIQQEESITNDLAFYKEWAEDSDPSATTLNNFAFHAMGLRHYSIAIRFYDAAIEKSKSHIFGGGHEPSYSEEKLDVVPLYAYCILNTNNDEINFRSYLEDFTNTLIQESVSIESPTNYYNSGDLKRIEDALKLIESQPLPPIETNFIESVYKAVVAASQTKNHAP